MQKEARAAGANAEIVLAPEEGNLSHWVGHVRGPVDTPYEVRLPHSLVLVLLLSVLFVCRVFGSVRGGREGGRKAEGADSRRRRGEWGMEMGGPAITQVPSHLARAAGRGFLAVAGHADLATGSVGATNGGRGGGRAVAAAAGAMRGRGSHRRSAAARVVQDLCLPCGCRGLLVSVVPSGVGSYWAAVAGARMQRGSC